MRDLFELRSDLESDQNYSLTIIRCMNGVLLGRKTRGFAEGKLVLPGGRENIYQNRACNAAREVNEETGLWLPDGALRQVGIIQIMDLDEAEDITVHVTAAELSAQFSLQDTNELTDLSWLPIDDLPYDEMPYDYRFFLPYAVAGDVVQLHLELSNDTVVRGFGHEGPPNPGVRRRPIYVQPQRSAEDVQT